MTVATGSATGVELAAERQWGSRAPRFIRKSRFLRLGWRIGNFAVGLVVIGAGVAMLVLPGPGWLVIFGGMAIWSTEFSWARIVLRWTRRKVTEAAQRALDPEVRRRNTILATAGVVLLAALIGVYAWKFGMVLPWNIK
nr:TIGR02611 family protein [Streptomyces sp. CS227]